MSDEYRARPSDLMKVWAMPKSSEQRQFTIRVPAETFYKLQALEMLYPHRSRNELVADLLSTALDEFEEALPVEVHESDRVLDVDPYGGPIHETWESGPRVNFRSLVEHVRQGAASLGTEFKVVGPSETAA